MRIRLLVAVALVMVIFLQISAGGEEMYNNNTLHLCQPDNYDLAAGVELGLANEGGFSDDYFELQAYYAKALVTYVDNLTNIRSLDNELANNELRLIPREAPVNVYQENGSFGMRYLFLRSNTNIERLDREEIDALRNAFQNDLGGDDLATQELIAKTFIKVTRIMPDKPDEINIILEPDGTEAPNMGIIFGISTDFEYDSEHNMADAEHEAEKNSFIDYLIPKMSEELTDLFSNPVTIVKY